MFDTEQLKELLIGSDIPTNQIDTKQYIKDELNLDIPEDAFILYLHQEYCFGYVRKSEAPNYPVYYGCEGEKNKKTHDSYQLFITDLLKQNNK